MATVRVPVTFVYTIHEIILAHDTTMLFQNSQDCYI